jgi:glycolate oxidase
MDRVSVNAVEDLLRIGLDRQAAAVLIAGSDGGEAEFEAMVAACKAQCATEVLSTSDPEEGEALMMARRSVLPAMERLGGRLLTEDVGVPLPQLPALVSGIEAIGAQRQTTISLIAHAGDGNTHPQIVFDPTDARAAAQADEAFGEIMELAIALGGTITGEHGIGRLKQPWLAAQLGPDAIALSERIKHALDPLGILNPGVMFR